MGVLTTKQRKNLSSVQFAGPNRTYPIPDRAHAVDAKARATQAVNDGRLTPAQGARIKTAANKVLAKPLKGDPSP